MRKFQFFVIVELVLLTLALLTILREDLSRFILLVAALLIVLRFYNQDNRGDFLLSASLLLLLFIFMLNPYIILMVVFAVIYVVLNHFSQVKKKNRYALVQFQKASLSAKHRRNQWIGSHDYESDSYAFDDINIIRMVGSDTIDLTQVIVKGMDNVILIRKVIGPTTIIVPIDVAIKAEVSLIYGSIRYLDFEQYDLRNETIRLFKESDCKKVKQVKLVINTLAGDVEVKRQ
ncbi:cell wall-active antibiotics response protein LiaF [Streptococcus sciuri]|uniref:Cell wall-active antibiotics response protein LiaF n=1 Tax=Streptococcus sciuri TaxID=2973939 RepID=A0ABT2F9A0_9STRE|nr:cell wall-active antibiotics response protein LiaF [Streptococcus sciuri]MCS4488591.1 cell wall-active antibiotics response protein LiaF [Streptococcus sciuri]